MEPKASVASVSYDTVVPSKSTTLIRSLRPSRQKVCDMRALAVILCSFAVLAACSRVRVVPLNPGTDERNCDAHEGIRYFLPKPSLLVTEGPASAQGTRQPEAPARSADQSKLSTDAEDLSKDSEQLAAEPTIPPADSTNPRGDPTRTPSPGPSTPAPGKPNTILGPTGPTNYTIYIA